MNELKNMIFLTIGSFFMAFAAVCFLTPNHIITGGGVGIAQLLYHIFPSVSLGIWIAIVSVPLMGLGLKVFGKPFLIKTLISIALISIFTDIMIEMFKVPPVTNQILLGSIFGGVFVGLGVGFVLKAKASTGGTTILAELISAKTKFKTADILLFTDGLTMLSSIFVYGEVDKALYSILGVFITTRIIGIVLSGKPSQKAVSIVSDNVDILSKEILDNLGENGTIINGLCLNQKLPKTLILVIVDISNLQLLKKIVSENDQDAFMVVQEASELHGRDY